MYNLREKLDQSYLETITNAYGSADWYKNKLKGQSKWSKRIRFAAIILVGSGGIFPLIKNVSTYDVSDWGYIAIALAGILIFLDRFFGFSSAWLRYILTEMDMRQQIKDFENKWKIELVKIDNGQTELTVDKTIEMLNMLKEFSFKIDELVKQETNSWAAEFQTNIAELQKMANAKLENLQPGSVKVVAKNTDHYKEVSIKVDNVERKIISGGEALIDNVSPGAHEIALAAVNVTTGKLNIVTSVVNVEANKMSVAEITLP